MAGYTKIFGSLLHSTVWQAPAPTRLVWITMLVLADRDGLVEASVPGLARAANVTLEECEEALEAFLAPDKYSRTPDHDGRRIDAVRGGWLLLNFEYYRELKSPEHIREHDAARQQRKRDRAAAERGASSRSVTDRHAPSRDVQVVTENPLSDQAQTHSQDPDLSFGSGSSQPPDRAHARSEIHAGFGGLSPSRAPRQIAHVGAATLLFLSCFDRYPRKDGKQAAAQVWQTIAGGCSGGEAELAQAIHARFDDGILTRHPYSGPNATRPFFETFLAERRWEDPDSAPDDVVAARPAETLEQRDIRARREGGERRAAAAAELDRKAREADAAVKARLSATGGAA